MERRLNFRTHMYDNCYYQPSTLNDDDGWSKLGRIEYIFGGSNYYKMHVGWRMKEEKRTLLLSLFYHQGGKERFVSHYIDSLSFEGDGNFSPDMYLGTYVLGLIIIDNHDLSHKSKSLGIRQDNSGLIQWPQSTLVKTFFFGGKSKAPHKMEMRFHDLKFDFSGYQVKFNSSDVMTWNLSEFNEGDYFDYFARKNISGSIESKTKYFIVNYASTHPNKEYQKCIIHDGAAISFTAGEKVYLHPGFHAKTGSYFRATIEPPAMININRIPQQFDEQISYDVENVKSVELGFYTDKTLDSLAYGKQFYVNSLTSIAKTTIDTILPLKKYYVVANFYSGKGSQKRVEGWVNNLNYGLKQNITDVGNTFFSSDYSIYPNPSSGVFNMKVNSPEFIISLEVINSYGQSVLIVRKPNSADIVIDISNQPKGMYILLVQTNTGVETYKLLKN